MISSGLRRSLDSDTSHSHLSIERISILMIYLECSSLIWVWVEEAEGCPWKKCYSASCLEAETCK
jgi:hypothetical protein